MAMTMAVLLNLTSGQEPAAPAAATPPAPVPYAYAASPAQTLSSALEAVRRKDLATARSLQANLNDSVARRIVDWAIIDVIGAGALSEAELSRAVSDFAGWPRPEGRLAALQQAHTAGLPPGPVPYNAVSGGGAAGSGGGFTGMRLRMNDALKSRDGRAAYQAISNHALRPGSVDFAEAESYAGWLALNKLRDPRLADMHFQRLEQNVKSPVSKARAAYWRGRAAEAMGDMARARAFYEQGAEHTTTFYGQLAAEKAGRTTLILTPDPRPTAGDVADFETGEMARALRLLSAAGERNLVRVFGLYLGETVETPVELAVLIDTLKSLGEQEVSLIAYRRGAQRGLILHERGYPLLNPPFVDGGAETAFVLAIVRQESQFDPRVRSNADARGMMQVIPSTGRDVARRIGVPFDAARLFDADYNMRIGSRYLGQMTSNLGGSYVMAAAGYNAGPGRPIQWVQFCGDPRDPNTDPLEFLECIPFAETRNYVMNVMSNVQVYRARLGNGRAPLTLSSDIRRGVVPTPALPDGPQPYISDGPKPYVADPAASR
ncbi:MAG: lytic transglycosylase domain-containing protein [Caulobacteraceae bacterium]|nr:MAG: lytic transglycosylase domain-containing protein [Caulobacteraceae bacterium]